MQNSEGHFDRHHLKLEMNVWSENWLLNLLYWTGGRPGVWPAAGLYWRRRGNCSEGTGGLSLVPEYVTAHVAQTGSISPDRKYQSL